MSARYEITEDAWGEPLINGSRAIMWSDTALVNAIRQQSADIAELRAELAAVVGELDKYRLKLREVAQTIIDQIGSVGPENAINAALRACEVIESIATRLAAIDAAPTVGWLRPYGRGLSTSEPSGERMPQYELIARPAKD